MAGVAVQPGDNAFTAMATDGAGNSGPVSAAMVVRRVTTGLPDLSVAMDDLAVLPAAPLAGSTAQVSAVVRNLGSVASPSADVTLRVLGPGGWAVTVADGAILAPLAPGGAQTVSGSVILAGGAGDYTLVAVADPLGRLVETSETDNRADLPFIAPADGVATVAIATDRDDYANAQPLVATVQVFNFGDPFSGRLEVAVEDAGGYPVTSLLTVDGLSLAYAESHTYSPTWDTGSTFAGAYRVVARLFDADGALVAEGEAPFTIADFSLLAARLETDRASYPVGSTARLAGTVDFLAGNGPLAGATAHLQVLDAAGSPVAEWTQALGDLLPGDSGAVNADWVSTGAPAGSYRAGFSVERGGEVLAQATTLFDLTAGAVTVAGTLTLSDHHPPVGVPLAAAFTAVGHGVAALPATPLRVRLVEPSTGSTVAAQEVVRDLEPETPVAGAFEFATAALGLGNFVAVLSAELSGPGGPTEVTLATAGFSTVDRTPPTVNISRPTPGEVAAGDPPVEVIALDALSPVRRVEARVDGGAWLLLAPIDPATGRWGRTLPGLAAGDHEVEARAFDTWDNVALAGPVPFTVGVPDLAVEKSWSLAADLDGDGVPSPGDQLTYQVVITNAGGGTASDVVLTDSVPENTTLLAASVQASQGQVVGADPVEVALGEVAGGAAATISFAVTVDDPFPFSALAVANQATVTAAGVAPVVSDDPGTPAAGDPTVTEVFIVPTLAVADAVAIESGGAAVFAVSLSKPSNRSLSIAYATAPESAAEGVDYAAASGTLTVAPGEIAAAISVPLLDDLLDEADETFRLTFSDPVNVVPPAAAARATIVDDDLPPAVSIADVTVAEGDADTTDAVFK